MRILIGEDDIISAELLKYIVESFGNEVVGIGHNCADMIRMIDKYNPDLLFQDISMNSATDGIEVGRYVLENYSFPHIYVTGHSNKTIVEKALITKPVGYIIKPFQSMTIYSSIQIALDHYRDHHEQEFLTIKDGYNLKKLPYYAIHYLKSDNIYVEIHTAKKVYIVRDSLEQIYNKLNQTLFIRTHRSYIINRHHFENLASNLIQIKGSEIPISRKYSAAIRLLFYSGHI